MAMGAIIPELQSKAVSTTPQLNQGRYNRIFIK
jgi:hypothetical protein